MDSSDEKTKFPVSVAHLDSPDIFHVRTDSQKEAFDALKARMRGLYERSGIEMKAAFLSAGKAVAVYCMGSYFRATVVKR